MITKINASDLDGSGRYIAIRILAEGSDKDGYVRAATLLEYNYIREGEIVPPAFSLTTEQAQRLMDALWNCGVRPVAAAGSAGQMTATQKHLEDMRAIVFAKLEIPKS